MDKPTSVHVEAASKSFGDTPAVKDFNLEIRGGEFVSLLGPSGCGKTTLLRMIAGFELPDSGRIILDGRDITTAPPHKRPVNMVFQRVTLFPHLNVLENVAFGLRLKRVAKDEVRRRVKDVLDLVRLPGYEGRGVETLSGGQAQRVALARAIVNRPKVLLLDEPLSALDLQIRRELQVELKDIHREIAGTFIYVTHDQEEAMSMSDRVVVMDQGEIVQVGEPVQLYRSPASLFVASFVGSPNIWRGRVAEVAAGRAVVDVGEHRLPARPTSGCVAGSKVALVLRPETISLARGAAAPTDNGTVSLKGTVADVRFVGAVVSYRVDLGGRQLTITRPSREADMLAEGDQVTAFWRPEDVLLLSADEVEGQAVSHAPDQEV